MHPNAYPIIRLPRIIFIMIFIGGIIQHGTYSVKALLHRIQKDCKLNKRDEPMYIYGHSAGSLLSEVSHELSNASAEDSERERPENIPWSRLNNY